jgi:hypothetical protein
MTSEYKKKLPINLFLLFLGRIKEKRLWVTKKKLNLISEAPYIEEFNQIYKVCQRYANLKA